MPALPTSFLSSFASAHSSAARLVPPAASSLILASVSWMLSFTIRSATSPLTSIDFHPFLFSDIE